MVFRDLASLSTRHVLHVQHNAVRCVVIIPLICVCGVLRIPQTPFSQTPVNQIEDNVIAGNDR